MLTIRNNRNQIVFTILRLFFNQLEFRLVTNQSENLEYNLVSVDLTAFRKDFCLWVKPEINGDKRDKLG